VTDDRTNPPPPEQPDAGQAAPRRLVAIFSGPVAEYLLRFGVELGFHALLVEPDPARLQGTPRPRGDQVVADLDAARLDEHTDVVLTDHHRAEIGEVLESALAARTRWIGILGNPRHEGPHVAALKERGVGDDEIARVHRPVGLNIGSRSPAEIAVATLAGLIADRNGRPGGFEF
jgi:xanthine/CO dehydrogenase XdhC/CoxF family maturation factor